METSENLYEPYFIQVQTIDVYSLKLSCNTFFELVYVFDGSGFQYIKNESFPYSSGHLMLLTPKACHRFQITTTTKFLTIRFNDVYIQNNVFQKTHIEQLDAIFNNARTQPGCILRHASDKDLVKAIFEGMEKELKQNNVYNKVIVEQLLSTLLVLVVRNLTYYYPAPITDNSSLKIKKILHFIQNNIFDPYALRASSIADKFGISVHYLGKFFKRETSETLQEYILRYKLKLIEQRLKSSNMRLNEIAFEFGFSDESHMNKFFKSQKGVSPSIYRKKILHEKSNAL